MTATDVSAEKTPRIAITSKGLVTRPPKVA